MAISAAGPRSGGGAGGLMKSKNSKPEEIRKSNIQAAKALSDAVRTSLGPRVLGGAIAVFFVRLLLLLLFFSKKVFQIRIIGGLLDPDPDPGGEKLENTEIYHII